MSNIISLVLILASIGLFFGYVDPTYSSENPNGEIKDLSIKELQDKKAEYDRALNNSADLRRERDRLLQKYNEIPESEREKLKKLVPDNIDNIRLIIDIDEMAEKYGMRVRNFKTSTGVGKDTIGADNSPFGTLTLSFSTSAAYTTFLAFTRDLEQSLRVIDITSVSFATGEGPIYDYNVTVKTYWLK